ncbi:MAG: anti-sigma regulatory factor [Actinomycetota bacterium]|nr:anti-sigma regulatory factor [Actinomycetota bacterium]
MARQTGRQVAEEVGFTGSDLTVISTAISELARNIIQYADHGEIVVAPVNEKGKSGIVVIAKDSGPGIPDIDLAMRDGYSTGVGMGLGLPGARRLMDEFAISSEIKKGTTVMMKKWMRGRA